MLLVHHHVALKRCRNISTNKNITITSVIKKELDKALAYVYMLVTDFQPFSIVDDKGFNLFVNLLDPTYKIPSKSTLRDNHLPALYEDIKILSITCDLWTSRANDSYLTVTAHFFDKEFTYRNAVLSTVHIPQAHTAENLATSLNQVFIHWDIKNKIVCVVTDNAANIVKACQNDVLRVRYQPCLAHTLNLIV